MIGLTNLLIEAAILATSVLVITFAAGFVAGWLIGRR